MLPGPVATNIGATGAPKVTWALERVRLAQTLMGPRLQPDEIAAAISWLASDEASNINGATLTTDSGWSAA